MTMEFEPARAAEFSTEDCFTLLATQQVGRLVTSEPAVEVRPVNFRFVDGVIVFRMGEPVADDSLVSFEVDNIDQDQQQGWSVVVTGHAASTCLTEFGMDLIDQPAPWAPGDKPWLTRIVVETISGRWVRAARTRTTLDRRGYL
jgi:hypothetical protein